MPDRTVHLGRLRTPLAVLLLIAATSAALAFGLGEGNRFGKLGAMGKGASGGGATNFLLANAGSVLLVNAGVKFLVQ